MTVGTTGEPPEERRTAGASRENDAKDALIRRRVLVGTFSNYAGRVVALVTWFLLTPFILHRLGAAAYGLWSLVGSVVGYGALLDLGIGSAITKFVAEYRARGSDDEARALVATAFWLYAALGIVAFALFAALAPLVPAMLKLPGDERATATWLVLLMGFGVGISLFYTPAGAVLRGLQRYDVINAVNSAGTIVTAVVTIVVLGLGGGVVAMVAAHLVISVGTQTAQMRSIRRIAPHLAFGWRYVRRRMLGPIAGFTAPIFVVNVAGQLQSKTDSIVIGALMSVSAVTPYVIALKLSEMARVLTDQFLRVLLPVAAELHAENDPARLRTLLIAATRLTLAIALPIGCTVVLLARPILTAWVGPEYREYAPLVAILTAAIIIDVASWPAGLVLQGMTRHRPLALMAICSGVANLILSIVLVRRLGLAGVALGTLIPTTVEIVLFVMPYAARVIGMSVRDAAGQIVTPVLLPIAAFAAVLMAIQRVVAPASLLAIALAAAASSVVYLAVYLAVGAGEVERAIWTSVRRTIRNGLPQTVMKMR